LPKLPAFRLYRIPLCVKPLPTRSNFSTTRFPPRVVIDLEKLRHINTGLGRFSLHLGRELLRLAPGRFQPVFFLPRGTERHFPAEGFERIEAAEWKKEGLRRIDRAAAVVTVSQFTADDVRCHLDLKGKPVFLSRATSLPEIAGDKGFSFGSHEPESMAQVFHDGMARMDKTVRFADILRSPAASFSWASAAKRYAEVYGTVLASST
jgi:hypothetical protein